MKKEQHKYTDQQGLTQFGFEDIRILKHIHFYKEKQNTTNMVSLKETAKAYTPAEVKNIAQLDSVSIDVEIVEKTYKEGTPEEFTQEVIEVDGQDYRVPTPVIASLEALLKNPKVEPFTHFQVIRSGTTKTDTRYNVVPLRNNSPSST